MNIKRIGVKTTHQICSNQVIVTLTDAVKELLENSLDATSSRIDIKLQNFGIDTIEVIDDGCGILEEEIELITKRHATSKIKEFIDLENAETFGYRGEALHSLCYIGNVEMHTRHKKSNIGIKVQFDQYGEIKTKTYQARGIGTTIRIHQLFHRLPIRRQQLIKNSRTELSRMMQIVTGFCIGSQTTNINLQNSVSNEKLTLLVSGGGGYKQNENDLSEITHGDWLKKNTELLLGLNGSIDKLMVRLIHDVYTDQLDDELQNEVLSQYNVTLKILSQYKIRLHGWIQRPISGISNDRVSKLTNQSQMQYLIINGRPSDARELSKLIKDTYKSLLPSFMKTPNFILLIYLPSQNMDVNLDPDKRTVLFRHSSIVKALIKLTILSSLVRAGFSRSTQQFPIISSPNTNTNRTRLSSPPQKLSRVDWNNSKKLSQNSNSVAQKTIILKFKLQELRSKWQSSQFYLSPKSDQSKVTDMKSSQSEDDTLSESRTMLCIKSDLTNTKIIGQFNKGFILCTQLNESRKGEFNEIEEYMKLQKSLLIVDQHAADERYRLETLQKACFHGTGSGILKVQPLVIPEKIQVNYSEYEIAKENKAILEKIGYRFQLIGDLANGIEGGNNKITISLTALPCRNDLTLNSDDFVNLLRSLTTVTMDTDKSLDTVVMTMIPKLAYVLASNACRSAIMIGANLTHQQMKQVLANMSGLRYPWICAHGRPTLRYLCNIDC